MITIIVTVANETTIATIITTTTATKIGSSFSGEGRPGARYG